MTQSREAAFTLKALTGWISTVLSDVPNAVPEALLEAAAQLHDECLLVTPFTVNITTAHLLSVIA